MSAIISKAAVVLIGKKNQRQIGVAADEPLIASHYIRIGGLQRLLHRLETGLSPGASDTKARHRGHEVFDEVTALCFEVCRVEVGTHQIELICVAGIAGGVGTGYVQTQVLAKTKIWICSRELDIGRTAHSQAAAVGT